MSELYPNAPNLAPLSISAKARAFRYTVLRELQKGLPADKVRGVLESALENEQYEFAQGINEALGKFEKNPQLSLL